MADGIPTIKKSTDTETKPGQCQFCIQPGTKAVEVAHSEKPWQVISVQTCDRHYKTLAAIVQSIVALFDPEAEIQNVT